MCQSWTADQRPGGRDLRQAARSTQHDIRGREESEPLFGCSGGENLTGNEDLDARDVKYVKTIHCSVETHLFLYDKRDGISVAQIQQQSVFNKLLLPSVRSLFLFAKALSVCGSEEKTA